MRRNYRKSMRLFALLLMLATLATSMPTAALALGISSARAATVQSAAEDHSVVTVLHNGAAKQTVELADGEREVLTSFVTGVEPTNRTWQILNPERSQWVNIYGQSQETLTVTHSMVGSLLNDQNCAYIRSCVKADGKIYLSQPVCIRVSYQVGDTAYSAVGEKAFAQGMLGGEAIPFAAEENFQTVTIVINYIFDNGEIAFEPYGASIAKGDSFVKSIESHDVVGYAPFIRIGDEYKDAKIVELNYPSVTENITLTVIYEPAIVSFEIHHYLQDLYDDTYARRDENTTGKGVTGTLVPDGLALTEEELPGFKSLAYEKLTIAADSSTVVEIRYDRNYYLVDFDMQGGYGTEPVYTRYGASVGANVPIRHGYVFDGWELVSYGGKTPTAEQASMYDINSTAINVPDANLTYRARWITQVVEYTMVFWKENIDDNGFSYWGYLDGLTAMSGSKVSGADRVSEVGGIDDEAYFTYCDALTDKDVLVEGDGSTIVNVYYSRNRYSITFKATGTCTIPVGHTHTADCYQLLCTKGHVHTEECNPQLTCTKPEHLAHTDACVICGLDEHAHGQDCCGYEEHRHTNACFNNVGNVSSPNNAPTNVEDGYIYAVGNGWWYTYYIHINGSWYRYTGRNVSSGDVLDPICGKVNHTHGSSDCDCDLTVHTHTDACYSDALHAHDADNCYSYSCDSNGHVHTDGCSVLHCGIPMGHSHTNTCRNSSSTNTVKIEYRKYQQSLENIWPITDDNGKVYNSGERWSPSGSSTYSAVLVYIANMPGESFTLTLSSGSGDLYTMNYYLEVLDGAPYDVSYNGKNYILYTTVKARYNYITEAEDFFAINGYYQHESDPAFRNGEIDISGGGTVNFYYGRIVDHYLEFQSNGVVLSAHTQHGLPYGQSLKDFNFVPEYPASLEPNAYEFAGWYTSPGHYDGTEVNWDTLTMDAGDILLYAKWKPVTHTVKVYRDNTLSEQIGETQYVSHNRFASAPTETVTNGIYIFQGWFYQNEVDGRVEERAFVFTGIPIVQDLQIYAKWSSHVTVDYKINYVLETTKEPIADPTVGSALAGHNKTFYAKAGNDLYVGFREGYYPKTSSHTVTMSADGTVNEFTFEYEFVESMPYLVRYVDENGQAVLEQKAVLDNSYSVVTETFVRVDKMMPDAYQKRLVLSSEGTDADGDGILDNNVITFRYQSDEEHAYYRVVHYIENLARDGYREYRSEDAVGVIGTDYTVSALSITGFSFNGQKTLVNGTLNAVSGSSVVAKLTSDGLLVELYYDRVDVGYTVKYLDSTTKQVLYTEKQGVGIFGEQIVENAPGLTHLGYSLVGDSVKMLHLSANEAANVIEFYYQETIYSLKYQIVGLTEAGSVSVMSENIPAVTGEPTGSIPYVNAGYHFVGWFLDEACTRSVPEEWVDPTNHQIIPKNDGVWLANHTYYVKLDPDFTSMTITTLGCADVDVGQLFLFRVQGVSDLCADVDLTVTVVGNGTVTLDHLRIGSYTVTEITEWSYRYTPDADQKSIELSVTPSKNHLTFSHIRSNTKWLDGNDNNVNDFGGA